MVQNWQFQSDKSSQISTLLKFPTYLETSHMSTSKSLRLQPINTTTKYVVTCNMKNTYLQKERCPVSPVVLHFLVQLRRAQHFQTGSHFPREKAISNQSWNFTQRRPSDTSYSQILPSQRQLVAVENRERALQKSIWQPNELLLIKNFLYCNQLQETKLRKAERLGQLNLVSNSQLFSKQKKKKVHQKQLQYFQSPVKKKALFIHLIFHFRKQKATRSGAKYFGQL